MSFIKLKNICHSYLEKDDNEEVIKHSVLNNVSLDVERGQYIVILGKNGSGKSTLARQINSLLYPDEGTIWIDGCEVNHNNDEMIWNIRSNIGMVFQNPDNQIIGTSVQEDTAFGPENLCIPTDEIRNRVDQSLEYVHMNHKKECAPNHLSGGQKQRVAIAGVLAMQPQCIILDESTAMLDPDGRNEVLETVRKLNNNGITIIMITHFMEEALEADSVIVMDNGKVKLQGKPDWVFEQSEVIEEAGLELPVVLELTARLKKDGYDIGSGIVSIEDFVNEFENKYRSRL